MKNSRKTEKQLRAVADKMFSKSAAVSPPRDGLKADQSLLAHADYVKMPNDATTLPQTLIDSAADGPKALL